MRSRGPCDSRGPESCSARSWGGRDPLTPRETARFLSQATLGAAGRLRVLRVVRGLGFGLDEAAADATNTRGPPRRIAGLALACAFLGISRARTGAAESSGTDPVVDLERVPVRDLAQRIDATFASGAADDRVLFLAAERTLNYEGVLRILDLAQSRVAGLRIGFVRQE